MKNHQVVSKSGPDGTQTRDPNPTLKHEMNNHEGDLRLNMGNTYLI